MRKKQGRRRNEMTKRWRGKRNVMERTLWLKRNIIYSKHSNTVILALKSSLITRPDATITPLPEYCALLSPEAGRHHAHLGS